MPLQQAFLTQFGLAKETTWGTAVAPTTSDQFLPINNPKPADKYNTLLDSAQRGTASKDYAYYQGVGHSELDFDCYVYPSVAGHLFMGIMGTDSISGAGPYTHAFTMATNPPSYTYTDFSGLTSGGQSRAYAGMKLDTLNLKFATSGDLRLTCKYMGKLGAAVAKPTATYTTENLLRAWQAALTLAGGASTRLVDFDVTLKRPVDLVFGANASQNPTDAVHGEFDVSGKATFASYDETELLYYLNNTQPALSLNWTDGTNQLTYTQTKTAFMDATTVDRGATEARVTASFVGIHNTTDSGPCKVTVISTRATAY